MAAEGSRASGRRGGFIRRRLGEVILLKESGAKVVAHPRIGHPVVNLA